MLLISAWLRRKPHDSLTTNTPDEGTDIAKYVTYVACASRLCTKTKQSSTRSSHDVCQACHASRTMTLHKDTSTTSEATPGLSAHDGQLAPMTTLPNNTSIIPNRGSQLIPSMMVKESTLTAPSAQATPPIESCTSRCALAMCASNATGKPPRCPTDGVLHTARLVTDIEHAGP